MWDDLNHQYDIHLYIYIHNQCEFSNSVFQYASRVAILPAGREWRPPTPHPAQSAEVCMAVENADQLKVVTLLGEVYLGELKIHPKRKFSKLVNHYNNLARYLMLGS